MAPKIVWNYRYSGEGGMDSFLSAQGAGWLSRKAVTLFGLFCPYTLQVTIPSTKEAHQKYTISTIMFFGLYQLNEEFTCGVEFLQTLPNGNEYKTVATIENQNVEKGELSIRFKCKSTQSVFKDMQIIFSFHHKYATSIMIHPTGTEAVNFFARIKNLEFSEDNY